MEGQRKGQCPAWWFLRKLSTIILLSWQVSGSLEECLLQEQRVVKHRKGPRITFSTSVQGIISYCIQLFGKFVGWGYFSAWEMVTFQPFTIMSQSWRVSNLLTCCHDYDGRYEKVSPTVRINWSTLSAATACSGMVILISLWNSWLLHNICATHAFIQELYSVCCILRLL